jgi:hypothetical protein
MDPGGKVLPLLYKSDRWVSASRPAWLWLGQLALVVLGVHLAADALRAVVLDLGPVQRLSPGWALSLSTIGALTLEVAVTSRAAWILLASAGGPEPRWQDWRARQSVEAWVRPVFWATMSLSGTWVVVLAVEELTQSLPAGASALLAWAVGLAVLWRLGWSGWRKVTGGLFVPRRRTWGLTWAPLLLVTTAAGVLWGLPGGWP